MNCTFDIETLGIESQSAIVQIAAVVFDDKGIIVDEINVNADLSSIPASLKVNYETLKWWFIREKEVIDLVMTENYTTHKDMCILFSSWVSSIRRKYNNIAFWSHVVFDPVILSNNLKEHGIENPLIYNVHRDIRTLTHLCGMLGYQSTIIRGNNQHNAIDDCIYQAKYISQLLNKLNDKSCK